jgi:hypothetical protein
MFTVNIDLINLREAALAARNCSAHPIQNNDLPSFADRVKSSSEVCHKMISPYQNNPQNTLLPLIDQLYNQLQPPNKTITTGNKKQLNPQAQEFMPTFFRSNGNNHTSNSTSTSTSTTPYNLANNNNSTRSTKSEI